ncbi:hypothetical protein AB0C84_35815 [Actinomadura sp. NPDC048955]|uniref:hypothetical protein n=1 Tax=Actinomadura sp. NPDC048955 TaxID=3158228 RepID=UPI0033F2E4D5
MREYPAGSGQRRLPQLHELEQVAELLNLPGVGSADLGEDATVLDQSAVLLAQIATWAADGAQNAKCGIAEFLQQPRRYAYRVEAVEEGNQHWHDVVGQDGYGIQESADGPEAVAVTVLLRFLGHVRAHRDDYEYLYEDEVHVRASVWDIHSVAGSWPSLSIPEDLPDPARFAFHLAANRISPHARELRTPRQVRRHIVD